MEPIGMAILFTLFVIALASGTLFLIYAISSLKRDAYYLNKAWYYCKGTDIYNEYECPYCFKHIKVLIYGGGPPDKCPKCLHKVRREED